MDGIGKDKQVLVVDDCSATASDLCAMYERMGFNVCGVASNGVEAIELMMRHNPDLVSLDIIMPEMDGIECFRKMQGFAGHRKYIIVSALASDSRLVACYAEDIPSELFLPKPVSSTLLEERVRLIMEKTFEKQLKAPPPPPVMTGKPVLDGR